MRRNKALFVLATLIATLAITILACTGDDPLFVSGGNTSDGGVTESGNPAAVTLSFEPMSVASLAPGATLTVKVRAVRAAGVVGSVKLTLSDPAGEITARPSISLRTTT